MERLDGKRILLGVTGSIAAYKACELLRELTGLGAEVQVAPTRAALAFVGGVTFEALSKRRVLGDVLEVDRGRIPHVEEAYRADAFVVAPASADALAKMAHGLADEALFATLLSFRGPLIVAPSMETRMWEHPATRANVATLKERGAALVGPDHGPLASGRSGAGRLAPIPEIVEAVLSSLAPKDLAARSVLITAGPTCEDVDPVRFLTNRSTGRMGVALARAAAHRGAAVTLVHGPLADPLPKVVGLRAVAVRSAAEMLDATLQAAGDDLALIDAAILSAAVADYRPAELATQKIKKSGDDRTLVLTRTGDILKELGQRRAALPPLAKRPVLVGFAAETENVLESARKKLDGKGVDLICANDVTEPQAGFQQRTNRITLVSRDGERDLGLLSKDGAADRILTEVVKRLPAADTGGPA